MVSKLTVVPDPPARTRSPRKSAPKKASTATAPVLPPVELPDVPWVTTSERRAFKRCPWRWDKEYREGLRSRDISDKLWFGIGVHEALADYYRPGKKRSKTYIDVWRKFCDDDEVSVVVRQRGASGDMDETQWVNARALGEQMLAGHHEFWGGDPNWDVIYAEEPFQIIIPHPTSPELDVAIFTSTFDGVVRDSEDGRIKLLEHKTAASISTGHLPMDDQGGAYWAVATNVLRGKGILGPKERIHGIVYNFLRKSLPDERPKDSEGYATNSPQKVHYQAALEGIGVYLGAKASMTAMAEASAEHGLTVLGERSKVQPPVLFERETVWRTPKERATQIKRIGSEVLVMNKFRDGELPLYKTPTRDCPWDCPVYNLCELDEQQQDVKEFQEAVFKVEDPYGRYRLRKSAAEGV